MEPEKTERISHKDDKTPSTKKGAFINAPKSSYESGKVHEISFKAMEPDISKATGLHPRKLITIYRKLSEQEYNTLKKSRIFFNIVPSDVSEHEMDVYNIEVPKELYGSRKGPLHSYFIHSSKDQINSMSAENKAKVKLELVPLTQLAEKGIGRTQMKNNDLKSYFTDAEKNLKKKKQSSPKPVSTDKKEDDPHADDRKKASQFTTDDAADRLFNKIISSYNNYKNPNSPNFGKAVAKEMFFDVMDDYFKKLQDFTDDPYIMAAVLDLIEPKLSTKADLFKQFVAYFDKKIENMKEVIKNSVGDIASLNSPRFLQTQII